MKWYKLLIISGAILLFGFVIINNIIVRPEGAFALTDYTIWYGQQAFYIGGLIGIVIGMWMAEIYQKLTLSTGGRNELLENRVLRETS